MKPRLTTILCADVAGYSRLTGLDEEGTHRRLGALSCLSPRSRRTAGPWSRKRATGLLAEFASVVEAMRCATRIQQGTARHNAGFPPDRHILFRIGVNLGDVIVEDGDIFGDGVNVAVRLEGLAEPGGIVVSN